MGVRLCPFAETTQIRNLKTAVPAKNNQPRSKSNVKVETNYDTNEIEDIFDEIFDEEEGE
jgi:hypothetical protein